MEKTVRIAGAGIAGLMCAIALRTFGHNVTIFEKNTAIGGRFHGDVEGIDNWSKKADFSYTLAPFGVALDKATKACRSAVVISPKGRSYEMRSKEPLFYLVKRGSDRDSFDRLLYDIAQDKGVTILFDHRVVDFNDVDIVATGPNPSEATMIANGILFETDLDDGVFVRFDRERNGSGYSYLIISHQKATLAWVKSRLEKHNSVKSILQHTVDGFSHIIGRFKIENPKQFGGYGVGERIILTMPLIRIGEAAGLQDHLLGFGMRYAIESALIAAQIIDSGGNYVHVLKKELVPSVEKTKLLRKILYRVSGGNLGLELLCRVCTLSPRTIMRHVYR